MKRLRHLSRAIRSRQRRVISKDLGIPEAVTLDLISSDRLQLNVYWAGANKKAADEVFKAAQDAGYLKSSPGEGVLYDPGT